MLNEPKPLKKGEEESGAVTKPIDSTELYAILKMLSEFGVREFELERGTERIRLKRGSGVELTHPEQYERVNLGTSLPGPMESGIIEGSIPASRPDPQLSVVSGAKAKQPSLHEVKSPMVGTFYRRPSPDAKTYVEAGDMVKKGAVLCIVEAMKLMNEIEADISGRIAEVCLEDGQMAEYGEVLFRIEPA